MVSLIIILPLSLLKNLGYLGYTSGLSLLCMLFFLIVVIHKSTHIPCPLPDLEQGLENATLNATLMMTATAAYKTVTSGSDAALTHNATDEGTCKPKYFIFNSQTVYAVPILTFAFVCHPAVLPIYEELKDRSRKKMQRVSNVSFLFIFVMYLMAALFGYLTFNENVEPELLHTYSKVYRFDVVLLIVRLAVLVAVILTVPVVLFPIRTSVQQLLFSSKEFSWIRHTIITFIILGSINCLVISVPTIRDIFGFIGSSAASMLIFILPSAFYLKLVKKEPMKSMQKIGVCTKLMIRVR
ncbi:sodium-coupled neutral amino acid transporter 2 [Rhincodon typus]|uniref:sodium-coupled neutral amino acid transporter 2 n=1 Tax=Rhincodon typus TaxID=259920 RepID=UPI002030E005|nr:sodium-coupled neutral amino acid transporter 2 [Rhincodon typus]